MIETLIKFQKWLADKTYTLIVNIKYYFRDNYNLLSLIIDIGTIITLIIAIFKLHWVYFIFISNAMSYTFEVIKDRHDYIINGENGANEKNES